MSFIKEYGMGISLAERMYFIDSNILLGMTQFYYRGRCKRDELTEELKQFILKARMYGIQNQFSILEVCYDYSSNSLNIEQMNKIMIAYDELIMNLSIQEIEKHEGTFIPYAKYNGQGEVKLSSIFGCKLPDFMFQDFVEMKNTFYGMYLYFMKIYNLYYCRMPAMDKIYELFRFMTEDINFFLGYEFYLGTMLFIGEKKEYEIASGIFKPRQNPSLRHVLNAVIDVMQYRMAHFISDFTVRLGMPKYIVFATADEALQNYIECNTAYNLVMSNNMVTPINYFSVGIKHEYSREWDKFYNEIFNPCMYHRYMEFHIEKIKEEKRQEIIKNIIKNIEIYEKKVYLV